MNELLRRRLKQMIATENQLLSVIDSLRQIKNEGFEQEAVRGALVDLRKDVETELEEDRILEVLDFVTGFCLPERRIWEH